MANLSNINNKLIVTDGGNLLVNKTAANNATVGVQLMSTGDVNGTVSGDTVARFNRLGTDGEIIRFQHDTSTDGAINSSAGRIAIGSGTTGIFFDSIRDVVTPHNMTTNVYSTNISLGRNLIRFKDLYLSGKVVVGTGSTAAATINAYSTAVSTGLYSALRVIEHGSASSYWDIGATNAANTLLNFYHNGSTTPKIIFTHVGGATFAGDVGIGTTSPNSYSNQTVLTINGSSYGRLDLESSGTLRSSLFSQAANTTLAVSTGFFTIDVGSERLRIDTSGNVGIGVTGPVAPLDVFGAAVQNGSTPGIKLSSSNTQQTVFAIGNTGTRQYELAVGGTTSSVPGAFYVYDNNAADFRITLATSGNVGIGTTSPSKKLHVYNTAAADVALFESTQAFSTLAFKSSTNTDAAVFGVDGGGNAYIENKKSTHPILFTTNSNERMRIDSSGNVGIGTTAPLARLDVAGNTNQQHSASTTNNGAFKNIQNLSATGWLDQTFSAGRIKVYGYENGNVNVSYCEYYVIRSSTGYHIQQIGTRLDVGNTHGQIECQVSGDFLQVRNVAQSSLGIVRVVFSGMKN